MFVDDDGKLFDGAMNNRSQYIKNILLRDPELRPLSNLQHPFWPKIKEGEEDMGIQGVGKLGIKCADMEVLGCVIKLRLPQYAVNDLMDKYMRAGQYRGEYLRVGKLVPKDFVMDREKVLKFCREEGRYDVLPAERGKALVYDPRKDIEQFIKTYCVSGGGFKGNPRSFYRERDVSDNIADIKAVATHGSSLAMTLLKPDEWEDGEREANAITVADFFWRLYNTLRTLQWSDHASIHQRSVFYVNQGNALRAAPVGARGPCKGKASAV